MDPSSSEHSTTVTTEPVKWNVNIHGTDDHEDAQQKNQQTFREQQDSKWQPGMPLPQDDKTLGVKEGKQARVRFAEPLNLDQIRAHFDKYGLRGLTKDEIKMWRKWEASKGDDTEIDAIDVDFVVDLTKGDVTKRSDRYFLALVDKYKGKSPYIWNVLVHRWVPRAPKQKQPPKKDKEPDSPKMTKEQLDAYHHAQNLIRERHAGGYSREWFDHYLHTHGGKSPDEVEGRGIYSKQKGAYQTTGDRIHEAERIWRGMSIADWNRYLQAHGGKTPNDVQEEELLEKLKKDQTDVRDTSTFTIDAILGSLLKAVITLIQPKNHRSGLRISRGCYHQKRRKVTRILPGMLPYTEFKQIRWLIQRRSNR